MLKFMMMQKREKNISLDSFVNQYENNYVPLILEYKTKMTNCFRHFLTPAPYSLDGVVKEAEYDVMTELWFHENQMVEMDMNVMKAGEAKHALAREEPRFLDSRKTGLALIEEHESVMPGAERRSPHESDRRLIILLKRRPDLTIDQFIDYYESRHAPLAVRNSGAGQTRYRRLFLRPALDPSDGSIVESAYDVMTEVSMAADAERRPLDPEISRLYDDDEENFTYKPARRAMTVDTRASDLPATAL